MLGLTELPTIYKVAGVLGILLLLTVGAGILYGKGRSDGAAACQAGQAKAVADAQQKADKLANELIIAQAQAMATTEKVTTVYRDRITNAPQTNTCGDALRDAAAGVLEQLRGGQAGPAGAARPAVH